MKKKDQIKPTITSDPYEALADPRHRVAVDMRVEGHRLRTIAEELKLTEKWIAEWFMRGGPCKAAYEYRMEQWAAESKELQERIQESIHDGAADAIVTLRRASRRGSVLASKTILEMAGFQAEEKLRVVTPTTVNVTVLKPSPQLDGKNAQHPVRPDA